MVRTRDTLENAKAAISKELIWKVHFEAAQIEERTLLRLDAASKQTRGFLSQSQYEHDRRFRVGKLQGTLTKIRARRNEMDEAESERRRAARGDKQ